MIKRDLGFWLLIISGTLLLIMLVIGQSYSLLNYDHAVSMGLQESVQEVTPLGIAWAKSFALGDTLAYIPFLALGIIGLMKNKKWGIYCMFASLAVSLYWPIVNLSAIYYGKNELALNADKYVTYSILLPLISLYGLLGMWYLYKVNFPTPNTQYPTPETHD